MESAFEKLIREKKDAEGLVKGLDIKKIFPTQPLIISKNVPTGCNRSVVDFRVLVNDRNIRLLYATDANDEGVVAEGYTPLSWNSAAKVLGLKTVPMTQDIQKIDDNIHIYVPTWDALTKSGHFVFHLDNGGLNYAENGVERIDLGSLLIWLTALPGFSPFVEEYLIKPDDGVVITNEWFKRIGSRHAIDKTKDIPQLSVRHQVVAYMILMMIYKSINTNNRDNANAVRHCQDFVLRRARAMLASTGKSLEYADGELLIAEEILLRVPSLTAALPVLKSTLIGGMLSSNHPICQHSAAILENSSASVYSFTVDMIESEIVTRLHLTGPFLVYAIQFWENHEKLVADYGHHWRYYKCMNPLGQRTAMTQYALLGSMAISWASVHLPNARDTLNNMEGQLIKQKYVDLARQRLVGAAAQGDFRNAIDLLRMARNKKLPLKINFEELEGRNLTEAELYVQED